MDLKTLHALPSIVRRPDRKRVGRGPGSGLGKTAGRGQKGAGARSGWRMRDFYEGGQTPLMRRIPKRGFSNDPFATRFAVVNVGDLNCFPDGAAVDLRALEEAGLVKQPQDGVKVLGDGELERKLTVTAHRFSKSAVKKIEAKGGKAVALLPPRPKKKTAAQGKPGASGPAEGAPAKAPKGGQGKPAAAPPAAEKGPKKKGEGEAAKKA